MSPARSAERAAVAGHGASDPGGVTPPGSPAIHTIELSKRYRSTVALAGLSMTVARGEVFGFLGPNGAGKTTAVKLLLGLARPTGGEAMVLGAPAGDLQTRRQIGYLPELFRFQSWLTAREVLVLHCRLMRMPRPGWAAAADEALHVVGLDGRGDDKIGTFSKGMQQRLGLGVALLGEPALVVLDEPTSALDPVGRHHVRVIIRELRDRGATVFLNTHLLEEAEHVCDRVTIISKGRSLATGTLAELKVRRPSARLRVTGLPGGWWRRLANFGRWTEETGEGDWLLVEEMAAGRVPELVAAIVALGGRVEAVIPEQQSLEESFLKLLGET
jgi:ABC-2 type transport system ATP-binding protein